MNWDNGRQEATYFKKNLFKSILSRFEMDCYLIKIPAGSKFPPHKDSCVVGKRHIRTLIQLSLSPKFGGNLYVVMGDRVDMLKPKFLGIHSFLASESTHWTDKTNRNMYYLSFGRLIKNA